MVNWIHSSYDLLSEKPTVWYKHRFLLNLFQFFISPVIKYFHELYPLDYFSLYWYCIQWSDICSGSVSPDFSLLKCHSNQLLWLWAAMERHMKSTMYLLQPYLSSDYIQYFQCFLCYKKTWMTEWTRLNKFILFLDLTWDAISPLSSLVFLNEPVNKLASNDTISVCA